MLWACIHLPQLPLLVAEQGLPEPGPLIIEVTERQRRLVAFANEPAQTAGIRAGMTIATALSLLDSVTVQAADRDREDGALQRLAVALYQFSPYIHRQRADSLLIELVGSVQLFNGAAPLAEQMQQCIAEQFREAKLALCSNPWAALLLARAACTAPNSPAFYPLARIDGCAVCDLELTPAQQERLASMGITRVGELLALPRDAVGRRFGQPVISYLSQLQGLQPSPRQLFELPETFAQGLDLPQEVEQIDALLFPLQRLVGYLEQFLRARAQAVTELELCLRLRQLPGQSAPGQQLLSLRLASAAYRSSHIMPLLQLQLERYPLDAPVLGIAVTARHVVPLVVQQRDLLGADEPSPEDRLQLLDRLRGRLGDQQVVGLAPADDHRPELGWQATRPERQPAKPVAGRAPAGAKLELPRRVAGADVGSVVEGGGAADQRRPCWLLHRPLPLEADREGPVYGAALQLLGPPERIDTGWWDGQPVERDYYRARHANGQRYWVFYDRRQARWFLHGVFG